MIKQIFKWIGILLGLFVLFVISFAIFVPTSPESPDDINQTSETKDSTDLVTTTTTDFMTTEEFVESNKTNNQTSSQQNNNSNTNYTYYSVSNVVDGDTVKINMDGQITTLRLIGMDTPEIVDPRKSVQCFGKEASNKAKELLVGKKVRIEKDSTQGEVDKYGRTLAYVHLESGLFFNKYMIEQGYAHEYTYDTSYKYQSEFKTAQKNAQSNKLGLWSPNTCNGDTTSNTISPSPTPSPVPSSQPVTTQPNTGSKYYTSSYHSSKYYYPEACNGWEGLSATYLKSYNTLEALLNAYPSRTKSPTCD